jgi:hypothetical protein
LVETRTFDPATLLPLSVKVTSGGTNLLHLGLTYPATPNNNQNIASQTISSPALSQSQTQTYLYDQAALHLCS